MTGSTCCCDDICTLRGKNSALGGWNALLSAAPQLAGIRRKRWTIKPASDLANSAKAGCQMCLLLYKTVEQLFTWQSILALHLDVSNIVGQIKVTVVKQVKRQNTAGRRKTASWNKTARRKETVLETEQSFYLSHPEDYQGFHPFGDGVLQPPRQPRPGHLSHNVDAVIHQIQAWVRLCTTSHSACQHGGYAPTRLLRLKASNGGTSVDTVQLIEPLRAFSTPFIALSHCWGKTQQAVTTKANYVQRRAGIPVSELSRTLQDAIWITNKLGVKYLWVDTLCIIQDDPNDWDREAINMYRLYGAAYVTLAASHGSNGDAGIFPPAANGNHLIPLSVDLKTPGNVTAMVDVEVRTVLRLNKDSQVHKAYGMKEDAEDAYTLDDSADVLQTRGWVLQERALSTRIVHFNAQELVWECRDKRTCECGMLSGTSFMTGLMGSLRHRKNPEDDDDDDLSSGDGGMSVKDDEEDAKQTDFKYISQTRKFWQAFVKMYTNRALTKPQDRGPAFAGIAQTFQKIVTNGDETDEQGEIGDYFAGLWAEHLPSALLWSCATDDLVHMPAPGSCQAERKSRRIEDAHAPSWSWFSVTGPCTFFPTLGQMPQYYDMDVNDKRTRDMELSFYYNSANNSLFGRLTEVSLVVESAPLFKARRTSAKEKFMLLSRKDERLGHSSSIHITFDDEREELEQEAMDVYLMPLTAGSHRCLAPIDYRDCSSLSDDERELMLLEYDDVLHDMDWDHAPMPGYEPLEKCDQHNFGVALVSVDRQQQQQQQQQGGGRPVTGNKYRRVGVFHMRGDYCASLKISKDGLWYLEEGERPTPGEYGREIEESIRWEEQITLL